QPQCRERGHARLLRGAGGLGDLVARHHGRCPQGAGLRRTGTPQLCANRCSGTDAMRNGSSGKGRTGMRKILLSMALVVLIGGPGALAQQGGGSSTAVKNTGPPPAPAGHRQPRASDVPNEKNLADPNDPLSKENAALDRKIKRICRGC